MKGSFLIVLMVTGLLGCGPGRNLVYFSDLQGPAEYKAAIENAVTPRIQPNDLLGITVSSLNPESNVLFNSGVLPAREGSPATAGRPHEGYLVDKDGAIHFPVVGPVKLGGLTREEAGEVMTREITRYVKNPIVNLRFLNFKVTVIGEVNNPSTFTVATEKINLLEALGLAGDMTAFGRRENVLLIREKDGVRTATRINLNRKEVLGSPWFYLQQNDIVYVEPDNRTKVAQTSPNNRFIPIWTAVISTLSTVAILLITVK